MFQSFIQTAINTINPNSPKIKNKFYHRNRVIDMATRLAIKDKIVLQQLYDQVYPEIIECEYRANFFGKPIGTIIGYKGYNKNHSDYWKRLAKIKKQIKIDCNQFFVQV